MRVIAVCALAALVALGAGTAAAKPPKYHPPRCWIGTWNKKPTKLVKANVRVANKHGRMVRSSKWRVVKTKHGWIARLRHRRCGEVMPPSPNPHPSPSGEAAPQGDLPGWRQIFLDDFTTDVSSWGNCTTYDGGRDCPSLPAAYRSKWWAYPSSYQDTREKVSGDGGFYQPSNMSMASGLLRLRLSRTGGTSSSAAPIPKIAGEAQTYGRYSIRARSDQIASHKVAWLLWRTAASWGEIDFPEADLDGGETCAFNHHPSGQGSACTNRSFSDGAWHTYTTEWTPGNVSWFMDGVKVGQDTTSVPSTPMTWVIQSETRLGGSLPASASGNIDIDWVSIWSYAPGPSPSPPPPPGGGRFGLVANSNDLAYELSAAQKVGAHLMRREFDASASAASVKAAVDQAAAAGVELIPQADIDGDWMGAAANMDDWARAISGKARFIEFGNENGYSYKGTQNEGAAYGRAVAVALEGMAGTGVGLLAQGDDGNTGSGWIGAVRSALAGREPGGWTLHPYGPRSRWEPRIGRAISELPAGAPLYLTEWGVASDNGACLNDNYGFDPCMSYTQAGDAIRASVTSILDGYANVRALFLFQAHNQQSSGTGEREHYFGALTNTLEDKPGLTDDVRYLTGRYS